MTRKEFCELMAAGHEEARLILIKGAESAFKGKDDIQGHVLLAMAAQENALARAFRDLAKEQD